MIRGGDLDSADKYFASLKPGDKNYDPRNYDPDYASYILKKNTGYDSLEEQSADINSKLNTDASQRYQLSQQNAPLQNPKIKSDYDRLTGPSRPRGPNKISADDLIEFAEENPPPGNDPLGFAKWKNPPSLYDWFVRKHSNMVIPSLEDFNSRFTALGWPAFDATAWAQAPDNILLNIWQHIQAGDFPNYVTERQRQDAARKSFNDQQFWQGFAQGFFKTFGPFEPLLQFIPGGDEIKAGLDLARNASGNGEETETENPDEEPDQEGTGFLPNKKPPPNSDPDAAATIRQQMPSHASDRFYQQQADFFKRTGQVWA